MRPGARSRGRSGAPPGASPAARGGRPLEPRGPGRSRAALALAPLAAVVAAAAGLVFLVLLPVCGLASIAQALAQGCWALVREAFGRARPRTPPPRPSALR